MEEGEGWKKGEEGGRGGRKESEGGGKGGWRERRVEKERGMEI